MPVWVKSILIPIKRSTMPRIARLKVTGEPAVYHVISRTALDGFVLGDVEKDFLLKLYEEMVRIRQFEEAIDIIEKRISHRAATYLLITRHQCATIQIARQCR